MYVLNTDFIKRRDKNKTANPTFEEVLNFNLKKNVKKLIHFT